MENSQEDVLALTAEVERLRKEMASLEAQQLHFRALLEAAQDVVYFVGTDFCLAYVNQAGAKLFEAPPDALLHRRLDEIFPPPTAERQRQSIEHVLRTGESLFTEHPYLFPTGERWLNARLYPVRDAAGAITGVIGTSIDITDRKKAERALQAAHEQLEQRVAERTRELQTSNESLAREIAERKRVEERLRQSEALYRQYLQSFPGVTFRSDFDFRLIFIHGTVEPLTGVEPAELLSGAVRFEDLIHPDDRPTVASTRKRHCAEPGAVFEQEYRLLRRDGAVRWVHEHLQCIEDEAGRPSGVQGVLRDITARREADEERALFELKMQQAQKLESLGMMAGGIAHDFNNLLLGVLGNLELAMHELPPGTHVHGLLEASMQSSQRLTELTRQMLACAGRGAIEMGSVDLSKIVQELVALLQASISKKVALVLELGRDLPALKADATQIRQVILNLIINAAEAIGDAVGTVTVRTAVTDVSQADLARAIVSDRLQPGRHLCLEVIDSGTGMDRATISRIFDPFFSTKFTGRGLGLPVVLGIVRRHGGAIAVESALGQGSTFRIWFPIAVLAKSAPPPASKLKPLALVVDDEQIVREVTCRSLESIGFRVLLAASGREAMELLSANDGLSIVLLDLNMPGWNGVETFAKIHALRPRLPVVISSGFAEAEVLSMFHGPAPAGFIQKPYRLKTLSKIFEKVLEAAPRSSLDGARP